MTDPLALRPRLFGIAYRIVGSIADAEDVVQSAYLRLEEHRNDELRNPGAWLSTVTTRLALDRARELKRRREDYVGVWLPEPIVQAEDPAAKATLADDLAIGFLRVLERLQPEERTAMLLHDVYDYSHAEIAEILGKNEDAVRQMAARARARVHEERPRLQVDRKKAAELVSRFLRAVNDSDIGALRAILATDVVAMADGGGKVAASRHPIEGIDNVIAVGLKGRFWGGVVRDGVTVNGYPGLAIFVDGKVFGVVAFDFTGDRIQSIYTVVNPDKLPRH
jgi:RNA polymerase sigma-70 factor (ECF subfamily)